MCDSAPPTEEERAVEISRALVFYQNDFTKYLATTIAYTETLPDEINNQIRNAFTHLSRAQIASTRTEVISEVNSAIAHIERANRDCLKASIIYAREELENASADASFYHGFLTPAIKGQHAALKKLRKDAYISESCGDGEQRAKLEEILRVTMHITDQIKEHYVEVGKPMTRVLRFAKNWFRPVGFLVAAIIGAVLRPFVLDSAPYVRERAAVMITAAKAMVWGEEPRNEQK